MKSAILVVEDNQDMCETITSYLTAQGYYASGCPTAEVAIDLLYENTYDLLLIDINLPGKSGFDLIDYMSENNYKIPLIAMTARRGIEDKIAGFELGLTDYIVKPFSFRELHARVKAHLRNIQATNNISTHIKTDNFSINRKNFSLKKNNVTIQLTNLEFAIMYLLMNNHNAIVTTEDLIREAWGDDYSSIDPPIRTHIANLRKKIGDTNFDIIKTIPGIGYLFNDTSKE